MNEDLEVRLKHWDITSKFKENVPLEEFCADCPKLLPEFKEEVKKIKSDYHLRDSLWGVTHSDPKKLSEYKPKDFGLPEKIDDKFVLDSLLGKGSFGCVWRAKDLKHSRDVAVKFPYTYLLFNKARVDDFIREAKVLAEVSQKTPHIVPVYDSGLIPSPNPKELDIPYIVMELMEGTLSSLPSEDLFDSPKSVAEAIVKLGKALHAAHVCKLIHRDIKPNNIFFKHDASEDLHIKLGDFGLALNGDVPVREKDGLCGDISYIAPERFRKTTCDTRSDIYSLGIVFYQLLTGGMVPFSGESSVKTRIDDIEEGELAPPTTINPELNQFLPLQKVCQKAIAKDRKDRYDNADQMVKALEKALKELSSNSNSIPESSTQTVEELSVKVEPPQIQNRSMVWLYLLMGATFLLVLFSIFRDPGGYTPPPDPAPKPEPTPVGEPDGGDEPIVLPGENDDSNNGSSSPDPDDKEGNQGQKQEEQQQPQKQEEDLEKVLDEQPAKTDSDSVEPSIETRQKSYHGILIEDTPLKDLFIDHPYDRSIKDPYPRVALTVKSVPGFHDAHMDTSTGVDEEGNYLLSATIWFSADQHEVVDDFVFRFPDDVCYDLSLDMFSYWANSDYIDPFDIDNRYRTAKSSGPRRTNGPFIPESTIPPDFKHQRFFASHMGGCFDVSSYDGLMICSLLYQMGFNWNEFSDKRVWLVQFSPALVKEEEAEPTVKQEREFKETLIEDTPLKDLFADYPYDSDDDDPYPRVALTVKHVPDFHKEFLSTSYGPDKKGDYLLRARVWYSPEQHEVVDDFIFRFPDDVCYGLSLDRFVYWTSNTYFEPLVIDDRNRTAKSSGPKRTNGPFIPKSSIPTDFKHQKFFASHTIGDLDVSSYDGLMVCSLLYQMGFDWNKRNDRRVWIVEFSQALGKTQESPELSLQEKLDLALKRMRKERALDVRAIINQQIQRPE